jgi:DNA polymerase-3 subunit delta'
MVEKLQHQAAPKLLKTIEEPPENSLILMITENYDKVLNTILSRSQLIKLSKYPDEIVRNELIGRYQIPVSKAANITRFVDGNFFHALKAAKEESEYDYTEEYAELMRNAFMVVHKKAGLEKLEAWVSKAAKQSRDNQIEFFKYCLNMTRQSMFANFNEEKLINVSDEENDFLSKFSPFINETNAINITEEINRSIRHIERNGNPNIVLLDMAFNIGKMLRRM